MERTGPDNYAIEVYWFDNRYRASRYGVSLSEKIKSRTLGWQ